MATTLQPSLRERFGHWWRLRSRTERALLALASGAVLAGLVWVALLQPMQRDIERLTIPLAAQRATLAEARHRAEDIAALSRGSVTPTPRDARAELDAALARQGVKASAVDRIDNDRLRLSFDGVGFDALPPLLEALQRDAKLRAVEFAATARVETGQVRVELTLAP
jgi:type II secretory pathway component PulM